MEVSLQKLFLHRLQCLHCFGAVSSISFDLLKSMIYDLNRFVDLRWLFDHRRYIHPLIILFVFNSYKQTQIIVFNFHKPICCLVQPRWRWKPDGMGLSHEQVGELEKERASLPKSKSLSPTNSWSEPALQLPKCKIHDVTCKCLIPSYIVKDQNL